MRIFLLTVAILGCSSAEGDQGEMPFQVSASTGYSQVEAIDGRRRYSSPPGSACMVQVDWWRPSPADPGEPMVVASSRDVRVLDETRELSRTSMFDGVEQEVQMLAAPADGAHYRIVFRECNDAEVDGFLNALSPGT